MIIILKQNPPPAALGDLLAYLIENQIGVERVEGDRNTLLVLHGDSPALDPDRLLAFPVVEDVKRIGAPYRLASRKSHPHDTVISVGGATIGGGSLTLMAGPCSVESEHQLLTIARLVKESGAQLLRGGAFKPRSSPYSFSGMAEEGLRLLLKAKEETGLPVVSEIMDADQLPLFKDVDILQVGARNMQNYPLLRALGRQPKPVLLKRSVSATYEEFLMSAEYILAEGNPNVILCERGIRTFERYTRSTLDLSAVPVLHRLTHLPVIVDPSHASGRRYLIDPLSKGAVAAGADGLLIEVHHAPDKALCDGAQAITPNEFDRLSKKLFALHRFLEEE